MKFPFFRHLRFFGFFLPFFLFGAGAHAANNPPTAALVSPPTGFSTFDRRPTFSFHLEDPDGNQVGYTISIDRQKSDGTFENVLNVSNPANLPSNSAGTNTDFTPTADLTPGHFRWAVTAVDDGGLLSAPSAFFEFDIQNHAPTATLIAPGNAAPSIKKPTFQFSIADSDGDQIKWKVEFSTDATFATILPQSSPFSPLTGNGNKTFTPTTKLPVGTVFWRVIVADEFDATILTPDSRSVDVQNHAPTATLISPLTGFSTFNRRPTFSFHIEDIDDDLIGYFFELHRQKPDGTWQFVSNFVHPTNLPQNSAGTNTDFTPTADLTPGHFRWAVRATDEDGLHSSWTSFFEFDIQNHAPTATLIAPADGVSSIKKPTFQFSIADSDGDQIKWKVEFSTDATFATILPKSSAVSFLENAGTFSFTPATNLPAGTIFWRVVLTDEFDATDPAPVVRSINVQNNPPTISDIKLLDNSNLPIGNGSQTIDAMPMISWKTVDADSTDITTTLEVRKVSDGSVVWNVATTPHTANVVEQRNISPALAACAATATNFANCEYEYLIKSCDDDGACSATESGGTFKIVLSDRHGNIGTARIFTDLPNRLFAPDTDSTNNKLAWNDTVGDIDLNPIGGGVIVENDKLQGYAWNDTVGWIRLNCAAMDPTATGIFAPDDCGTNNYAVVNAGGTLSGKALLETTGGFLYFDKASFLADFPSLTVVNFGTSIKCSPNNERGHFSGRAYSPDLGWVAFGWNEIKNDAGLSEDDAKDRFPISEWSCPTGAPILNNDKYFVFAAQNTDYKNIWIAQKDIAGGGADVVCNDNTGVTNIQIHKINSSGNDVLSLDSTDFEIRCDNPAGNIDGKIWITLKKDGTHEITKHAGLYRISGTTGDENGLQTPIPTAAPIENEYIFQIVAGEPELPNGSDMMSAFDESGNALSQAVADGDDIFRVKLSLKDEFGNPVTDVYKYEDPAKDLIKTAKITMRFYECATRDQAAPNSGGFYCNDVISFLPSVPRHLDTRTYEHNMGNSNEFSIDLSSLVPTQNDQLQIQNITATVTPQNGFSHVGEVNNKNKNLDYSIVFAPIVSAEITNFNNFMRDPDTQTLHIKLTNNSNNVNIDNFDWGGLFRTHLSSPTSSVLGNSVFRDVQIQNNLGTPYPSLADRDYYQEVAGGSVVALPRFTAGKPSFFGGAIASKLGAGVVPNPTINDRVFPSISPTNNFEFKIAATPEFIPSGDVEYPEFSHDFALNLGGQNITFSLGFEVDSNPITERNVAIAGQAHGENIDENVVVSGGPTDEFSSVNNIFSRQETREVMRKNYDQLTGPLKKEKALSDPNSGLIQFENWSQLQSALNDTSLAQKRVLQDGKVLWYWRNPTASTLTIVLGDGNSSNGGIDIPANIGPITIFVEGGNVFLNDDITIGAGSNLGIVALSSRENSEKGTEGNIFVGPTPTHLEGIFFAEGSLLSAKSFDPATGEILEENILDGFSSVADISDFFNQLLIKGAVVSQNIVGDSPKGILPAMKKIPQNCNLNAPIGDSSRCADILVRGILIPDECGTTGPNGRLGNNCNDMRATNIPDAAARFSKRRKASRRFDLLDLRRYKAQKVWEPDADGDGIKDSMDCNDFSENPFAVTASGALCSICQNPDGTPRPGSTFAAQCAPKITDFKTNGKCAAGSSWCEDPAVNSTISVAGDEYTFACGSTPNHLCENGALKNRKLGASFILEYDPKIKETTPIGMEMPPNLNFEKTIN